MIDWERQIFTQAKRRAGGLLALAACVIVLGAGCSGGTKDSPETTTSSAAASSTAKPAKFDPCKDIPEQVLRKEDLENRGPENSSNATTIWTGCGYQVSNGYDVRIVTTNLTLDQIKAKFPESYREQYFGGRRAAFYTLFPSLGSASCVLNVEMASGTLEFDLSNQKSASKTGHLETCGLLTNLVEQVVAAMSPGA